MEHYLVLGQNNIWSNYSTFVGSFFNEILIKGSYGVGLEVIFQNLFSDTITTPDSFNVFRKFCWFLTEMMFIKVLMVTYKGTIT